MRYKKKILAHRAVYEELVGPIPDGKWVLHSCDNPPCCNPAHLRIGTHADNTQDMVIRGRANPPKGERQAHAKLTDAQAAEIKRRLRSEPSSTKIAQEFGLPMHIVFDIKRGKTWKHITPRIARAAEVAA